MHESFCALTYTKWKLLKSQEKLTKAHNEVETLIHFSYSSTDEIVKTCKNMIVIKDVDLINIY